MPIVTVASGKGGVGKSTSVLALAAALAAKAPVVLDLDPGGDATRGAGIAPKGERVSHLFAGAALDDEAVAIEETAAIVYAIVPGGPHTAVFEATAPGLDILRSRLRDLGRDRLLVIDTAPGFASVLTRAAIGASDVLVVPLVLEPFAADRAAQVVDVARAQGSAPETLFVATMVDDRRAISKAVRDDLTGQGVRIAIEIPRLVAVAEAPWRGRSIVGSMPSSPATAAYRALGETISSYFSNSKSQVPHTKR